VAAEVSVAPISSPLTIKRKKIKNLRGYSRKDNRNPFGPRVNKPFGKFTENKKSTQKLQIKQNKFHDRPFFKRDDQHIKIELKEYKYSIISDTGAITQYVSYTQKIKLLLKSTGLEDLFQSLNYFYFSGRNNLRSLTRIFFCLYLTDKLDNKFIHDMRRCIIYTKLVFDYRYNGCKRDRSLNCPSKISGVAGKIFHAIQCRVDKPDLSMAFCIDSDYIIPANSLGIPIRTFGASFTHRFNFNASLAS